MAEEQNNEGVYFTELKLQNVRCFGDEAVLDLSDGKGGWARWNVILGDNGMGKTTLLQILSELKQVEVITEIEPEEKIVREWASSGYLNKKFKESLFKIEEKNIATDLFGNIIRDNSIVLGRTTIKDKPISFGRIFYRARSFEDYSNFFILGYGANRVMSYNNLSEEDPESSETLFDDDAKLINSVEWLLEMDYAANRDSHLKEFAQQRKYLIISALKEILPGITDINFTTPTKEQLVPRVEFKTPFGWVGIKQLSLGYKSMIAWIVDVAARMFERYTESDNPLAEPVVILVDEIDLHLHPKWQRQIFDFLTEKFPRAQFIVTAHSPLVVQSAPKDANLIVLKRAIDEQGNNYVQIDNDVESVRTWRLDQIMTSDLYGFESARNLEVEEKLIERKNLLQKEELTKEEKARLKELNSFAYSLPGQESKEDNEAMAIIRKAADYIKNKQVAND